MFARDQHGARIPYHPECMARSVIGSVGHQRRTCPCYGGTESDPEGMTKREAARAAVAYFRRHNEPGAVLGGYAGKEQWN